MSPERILKKPYNYISDFWSIGMLAYELVFGKTAFFDNDPIKRGRRIVMEPLSFPIENQISNEMKIFIFQLLSKSPKNRLGN